MKERNVKENTINHGRGWGVGREKRNKKMEKVYEKG